MAVLRDRATNVLDMIIEGFRNQGQPVEAGSPMQSAMVADVRRPSPTRRALTREMGQFNMQARPLPLERGGFNQSRAPYVPTGTQMDTPVAPASMIPTPLNVTPTPSQPDIPVNRLMPGREFGTGQGVMQPGMDREKMLQAGKVASDALNTGDESLISKVQGFFGGRENMLRLAMAFNTMRLQPDAGLTTALTSELKDVRAQSRAQSQRNATANWLRSQKRDDLANLVEQNMIEGKKAIELSMGQTGRVVTSAELRQKFPNIDIEDGLYNLKSDGTINKVGGGGVNVNIGPEEGKLSTDFTFLRDAEGNILRENGLPIAVPVPGSPAAQKAEEAKEKETGRKVQRQRAGGTVIQDIQRGLDLIPELSSMEAMPGVAGANVRKIAQDIEGTVTNRIAKFKESALSNVGLDTLQQMRENSPTGGALGQVPIQQQQRLEQVLGSLDVTQDLDVLQQNMKRVINIYLDIVYGAEAERQLLMDKGELTAEENAEINSFYYELPFDPIGRPIAQEIPRPNDIPQELWDVMEDEEKRALQ